MTPPEEGKGGPFPAGPLDDPVAEAQDRFILEWGRMSSSWGINRTMAQIHALLFVTGESLEVNDIMDRLQISRGNASMNLRELMDWGIVRRFRRPGDRKDTYSSETDPHQMIARIVRERKRREIDPTADTLREILGRLNRATMGSGGSLQAEQLKERLEGMLTIFDIVNAVYMQVFSGTDAATDLKELLDIARQTKLLPAESPGS